jgi:hypothetical protein
MSVDYLVCKHCGDTFCDCGDFVSCECGEDWCSDECAETDGYKRESCKSGYDIDDKECEKSCYGCENYLESSCNFCRKEDFEDDKLLEFTLKLLKTDRQSLINLYKESKGDK